MTPSSGVHGKLTQRLRLPIAAELPTPRGFAKTHIKSHARRHLIAPYEDKPGKRVSNDTVQFPSSRYGIAPHP